LEIDSITKSAADPQARHLRARGSLMARQTDALTDVAFRQFFQKRTFTIMPTCK
jgi:hypothetical protein